MCYQGRHAAAYVRIKNQTDSTFLTFVFCFLKMHVQYMEIGFHLKKKNEQKKTPLSTLSLPFCKLWLLLMTCLDLFPFFVRSPPLFFFKSDALINVAYAETLH